MNTSVVVYDCSVSFPYRALPLSLECSLRFIREYFPSSSSLPSLHPVLLINVSLRFDLEQAIERKTGKEMERERVRNTGWSVLGLVGLPQLDRACRHLLPSFPSLFSTLTDARYDRLRILFLLLKNVYRCYAA